MTGESRPVSSIVPRVLASALALSAAAFGTWVAREGYTAKPVIPTRGDVPTIGHGSTRYEDGTPVQMSDAPITRKRAAELAWSLHEQDQQPFRASIPGVALTQGEYDVYVDFVGQYGIGNWRASSMRRELLSGNYRKACDALLLYRRAAGYDCSTLVNGKPNTRCYGVWERQQQRHAKCLAEQGK
ncbi:MAG: hypothetical protein GAK31_00951 [Stenotrophomonas maltophilia]|uniref:Lysozyme n=1 Tax=Stenotrophomonas maltophilia TaxID=40324 RepID=A0A7V8JNI6_STEMA|nr:MAG: hypothetical protein GAK31_00951 [Stenotrophomonas maltophilia]